MSTRAVTAMTEEIAQQAARAFFAKLTKDSPGFLLTLSDADMERLAASFAATLTTVAPLVAEHVVHQLEDNVQVTWIAP